MTLATPRPTYSSSCRDRPRTAGREKRSSITSHSTGVAEELHGAGEVAWFDYCPPCADDGASTLTVIEPPLEFTISLLLPAPDNVRRISLERLARQVIERLDL